MYAQRTTEQHTKGKGKKVLPALSPLRVRSDAKSLTYEVLEYTELLHGDLA